MTLPAPYKPHKHARNIPLSDSRIKAAVIDPLPAQFSAVIDSEVDGDGSLPARMESVTTRRISQARAATRAARAVFLCSAPTVGQPNAGVNGQSIRLAAAEPDDQLAIFGEALRELHEKATYLYEDAGRYWFSTQPTLNRLADERARALDAHKVDEEIVKVLQVEKAGNFARLFAAPDDPSTIDEATALSLVILKPASTHTKGQKASAGIDAATDALMRCRSSQRRYRNTLVFAAADGTALDNAREVMRKALGWSSINADTVVRGSMTTSQVKDVEERTKSTKEAAEAAIRAAWIHLLYASKDEAVLDGKPFDIEQTTLLARDRSSIATSAYEKLSPKGDSIIKETLGPKILLSKLANLWPTTEPHLKIADLQEWFAAYVYLPKLKSPSVLESAIAEGVSSADPQFAYADGYDEAMGKYRGLYYGRMAPTSFPSEALIVRSTAAKAQLDASGDGVVTQPASPHGEQQAGGATSHAPVPEPAKPTQPTRFYGSVELDPGRPIRSFESVFNAVIALLQNANGAKVKLTLDIEAQAPEGFSDTDIRDVRDNSKQLKFRSESTGFE